jgi:hypothetical protein
MTATVLGRIDWSRSTDGDGNRDYKLKCLVECSSTSDGPAIVSIATGLPSIGSVWSFGGDYDPWAFCLPSLSITPVVTKEPGIYWTTEQTFSTKPIKRCQDQQVGNPLSEPQRISGSFLKYSKPAFKDRNGDPILSSSFEQIQGLERDYVRPTVSIEQNFPSSQLDILASAVNKLNDNYLWGLSKRKIKLTSVSWDRKYYGMCSAYYTRKLEFEVRFDGFDPYDIIDSGWMCLGGYWDRTVSPPVWTPYGWDKTNPYNFRMFMTHANQPTPVRISLDGNGNPNTDPSTPVFHDPIEIDDEYNFLSLGVPTYL